MGWAGYKDSRLKGIERTEFNLSKSPLHGLGIRTIARMNNYQSENTPCKKEQST